jgi:DNA-binding LacI/PurR family transcriptional regulator
LYRKVHERLRGAILDGEIAEGGRLPTTAELAAQFGTGICTVQKAMVSLEVEKLIARKQGVGTFVRSARPRLASVGIYIDDDIQRNPGSGYSRMLVEYLREMLEDEHIAHHVFHGDYDASGTRQHLPGEVLRAIRSLKVQVLLLPVLSNVEHNVLDEIEVPCVTSGAGLAHGVEVYIDAAGMIDQALDLLAAAGCRRVGVVTAIPREGYPAFFRHLAEAAQARGLALCEDKIRKPDEKKLHGSAMEAFGYREMTALAGQADRPDGVFVYPDLVGRGVILGALASGLSVPDDLRLVFHENIGMPLFRPFPAASVVVDPAAVARAFIAKARALHLDPTDTAPVMIPTIPMPDGQPPWVPPCGQKKGLGDRC